MRPYAGVLASSLHLPVEVIGGIASSDALYNYRTFLNSDTLTVANGSLNGAEILLMGGGGNYGQGFWQWFNSRWLAGGGGGAGGLILESGINVPAGSYPVTIGAAGGNNSEFYGFIAFGGGNGSGGSGGSGAGAEYSGAGGSGVAGQGNDGGAGYQYYSTFQGGGGGGKTQAGASGYEGCNGGNGIQLLDWANATNTGIDGGYYAGGGGGGSVNEYGGNPGLGGSSGPNTGSGGTTRRIQAGSGLFIIRWAKA